MTMENCKRLVLLFVSPASQVQPHSLPEPGASALDFLNFLIVIPRIEAVSQMIYPLCPLVSL